MNQVWTSSIRGRISIHWGHAYRLSQTSHRLDYVTWAPQLIHHLFECTHSLWKFRNGVVRGHNQAEAHRKKLEKFKEEIILIYNAYRDSWHLSSLFNKSYSDLLQMDQDFLISQQTTPHSPSPTNLINQNHQTCDDSDTESTYSSCGNETIASEILSSSFDGDEFLSVISLIDPDVSHHTESSRSEDREI